jgi:type II secretory pathway pseudopilin PulG
MFSVSKRVNAGGFALLEVVIAAGLIATVAAGASILAAMAWHASRQSHVRTMATMVASEKMEQLRSLAWTHVTTAGPAISMSYSDVTTDLSNDPATDDGPGLLMSPAGTLTSNIIGYVDYLDASGRWIGHGPSAPPTAVYVRRWAVRSHASDPDNTLVFEVVAGTRGPDSATLADMIRLVTIEARR